MPCGADPNQRLEMLGATSSDRVGKGRPPSPQRERGRFDFQVAPALSSTQQKIEAAVVSPACFSLHPRVPFELLHSAECQCFCNDCIDPDRVDIDAGASPLRDLPGPLELACRVPGPREPRAGARLQTRPHRTGVGTVRGDGGSVFQSNVRQKALVAPEKESFDDGSGEIHRRITCRPAHSWSSAQCLGLHSGQRHRRGTAHRVSASRLASAGTRRDKRPMVPASTQKVFAVFRQAIQPDELGGGGELSREQLLERTGLDGAALDAELDLLQKMVLITRSEQHVPAWRLTPLGTAACENSKTWETIFRR